MLIAVRAQVESADHWRTQFKTHADLFRSQGVSMAHMGSADENTVLAIFETNDVDEFIRVFNDPATMKAMSNDKVTGGVEMFVINESFDI